MRREHDGIKDLEVVDVSLLMKGSRDAFVCVFATFRIVIGGAICWGGCGEPGKSEYLEVRLSIFLYESLEVERTGTHLCKLAKENMMRLRGSGVK